METRFTFTIGSERLEKVKRLTKKGPINDFINSALDFYITHLETKFMSELMYYVAFPFLAFFGCLILTIILEHILFYILSGIMGVYLIILIYLFYSKYGKVKHGNNR